MSSRHWSYGERLGIIVTLLTTLLMVLLLAGEITDLQGWTDSDVQLISTCVIALSMILTWLMASVLAELFEDLARAFGVESNAVGFVIYCVGAAAVLYRSSQTYDPSAELNIFVFGGSVAAILLVKAVSPWIDEWASNRFDATGDPA